MKTAAIIACLPIAGKLAQLIKTYTLVRTIFLIVNPILLNE